MQLIWMSGPTSRVIEWSITRRTLLVLLAGLPLLCVLLGVLFHFWGLRVAVEHVPEVAHRIGGVTSAAEQARIEAHYREQLEHLHAQLVQLRQTIEAQDDVRTQLFGRLGLRAWGPMLGRSGAAPASAAGQGGPWVPWPRAAGPSPALHERLEQTDQEIRQVQAHAQQLWRQTTQEVVRLEALPLGLPLKGDFSLSSGFGGRADPFSHEGAWHEGLDLVAEMGTPVLASAPGVVTQADHHGAYGQMVQVRHAQGFVTRYAHLDQIQVRTGDSVSRGQTLGTLGNSGRSSGPHLHYEVLLGERAMHPAQALALWARQTPVTGGSDHVR